MNAGERAAVQARKNSVLAAVGRKRRLAVTLSAGWAGRELASCSSLGCLGTPDTVSSAAELERVL